MPKLVRSLVASLVVAAAVLVSATPAAAANRTWDGGGANNNWTTAENWDTDTAPQPGDTLVFPADPASPAPPIPRKSSTNDFPADTAFGIQIDGAGYTLGGNRITMGGVNSGAATNTIALSLRAFGGTQSIQGTGRITGDIVMTADDPPSGVNIGSSVIDGVISGPGQLILMGTTLNGNNTYTGVSSIGPGDTRINGNQPSSPVIIAGGSDGSLGGDGTIGATDLGTTGGLGLRPGDQLTVQGNFASSESVHFFQFTGTTPGTDQAQLDVNGTVTIKPGANLVVDDPNPPEPGTQITLIDNDGTTDAVTGRFTHLDEDGEGDVVQEGDLDAFGGNGIYRISYAGGDGNDVTITSVALPFVAVTDPAGPALVDVFAATGDHVGALDAYPGFEGGINIALGDFDGDGSSDLVTAPRAGGGPHIRVFLDNQAFEFMAYDVGFRGGVSLAVADVDNDSRDEIITGAGPGGGPHVKVFEMNGAPVAGTGNGFFPYSAAFLGGVNVGGLRRAGADAIVTGAGPGGGPHVRVVDSTGGAVGNDGFFAYASTFAGGVNVAGLVDDGVSRIITAPGPGGGPHIRVFTSEGGQVTEFMAYNTALTTGVFVSALPRQTGTTQDIVTGPGAGGPHVRIFSAAGGSLFEFMARDPHVGGAVVAGGAIR